MVSKKRAGWNFARKCCQNKHLKCDLASIENAEVMDFIGQYIPSDSAWIGAEKNKEIWSWSDGSTWNYQNWQTGKPNPNPTSGMMLGKQIFTILSVNVLISTGFTHIIQINIIRYFGN